MTSLTEYQKSIHAFTSRHGMNIGRGKIQRLALRLFKQQQPITDAEYFRLVYADPTAETAVRHVMAGAAK